MSGFGRLRLGTPLAKCRPVRQKLQFISSDGEDDPIEDVNNSTGGESGFTEMDSPMQARRNSSEKLLEGGDSSSSPLNQSGGDDDVELWDEDSLGSPTHLRSPGSVISAHCSPSPRKSSRLYVGSPERSYIQDDGEGSSSPIPDCPDTPPHKTFRKLRLFDTPHTPKVCIGVQSQFNRCKLYILVLAAICIDFQSRSTALVQNTLSGVFFLFCVVFKNCMHSSDVVSVALILPQTQGKSKRSKTTFGDNAD